MSKQGETKDAPAGSDFGDEELVGRAQRGDTQAYGALVERYQYRIFNLIRRLVSGEEVVEDLAQEVFIKAFRRIDTFRSESSFYTWIYKIALNVCRNHYRKRKPQVVDIESHEGEELAGKKFSPDTPEEIFYRRERARMVREAMEKLPAEQKEALVMRDLEGFSYQEIAGVLDLPIGTVRSRIFRGRFNLKGLLSERLEDLV